MTPRSIDFHRHWSVKNIVCLFPAIRLCRLEHKDRFRETKRFSPRPTLSRKLRTLFIRTEPGGRGYLKGLEGTHPEQWLSRVVHGLLAGASPGASPGAWQKRNSSVDLRSPRAVSLGLGSSH